MEACRAATGLRETPRNPTAAARSQSIPIAKMLLDKQRAALAPATVGFPLRRCLTMIRAVVENPPHAKLAAHAGAMRFSRWRDSIGRGTIHGLRSG